MSQESNFETPPLSLLTPALAMRRTGETLFETAKRVMVNEALMRTGGNQVGAARLLGITPRAMNYSCQDLRIRAIDRKRRGYLRIVETSR